MANKRKKSRSEIFSLTEKELVNKRLELEEQIFNLRLQWKTGQLANTALMGVTRKNLARVETALQQKQAQ